MDGNRRQVATARRRKEQDVRSPRRLVGARLAAVAGVVAVGMLLGLATTSPAQLIYSSRSYGPVSTFPQKFIFSPSQALDEHLVDAWLVIGGDQQHVSLGSVQAAARYNKPLKVEKPPEIHKGRLWITVTHTDTSPIPPVCAVEPATMTAPGCNPLREDTGRSADPRRGLWGSVDCASSARHAFLASGGDPGLMTTGVPQGDDNYRKLTVVDGDNFFGERCELGRNSHSYGENTGGATAGTFALYGSGEHRITFFSERYPTNFPTSVGAWQAIAQMKQAQPADNAGAGPVIAVNLYGGRVRLMHSWDQVWATRAPEQNTWTRYALDVVYSPDPAVGSIKLYIDLDADGDALDPGEQSPRLKMATQLAETAGPNGASDGLAPGDPIPDHLRLGLYHNSSIHCPAPSGCSVDVDNVQVVGP